MRKSCRYKLANPAFRQYKRDRRSVAQPGSASGLGPEGRGFESLHSDHFIKLIRQAYFGMFSLVGGVDIGRRWPDVPVLVWPCLVCTRQELVSKALTQRCKNQIHRYK